MRRSAVIKFIGFIKRKEGMSFEDFSSYWRYKHAALIAATPACDATSRTTSCRNR